MTAEHAAFTWGPRFYRTLSALTILGTAALILYANADQRLATGLTFVILALPLIVLFMMAGQRIADRKSSSLRLVRLTRIVFVAIMIHALVGLIFAIFAPLGDTTFVSRNLWFGLVEFVIGAGLALTNQMLLQRLEEHEASGTLT
ncbi:MAG: hypothetical protein QNJ09_07840 [Paracoccaceae bacterium]|nr:hypothetical protein [Paracoccaceae bacterium]